MFIFRLDVWIDKKETRRVALWNSSDLNSSSHSIQNMLSKWGLSQCCLIGGVPFCTTRWQCVHRQILAPDKCLDTSLPRSLFLTIFSRRWSSINTQQWGIYQGDFVLSSEANNYRRWWKIEHILKLNVISFSLCLSHTHTFKWFYTHNSYVWSRIYSCFIT